MSTDATTIFLLQYGLIPQKVASLKPLLVSTHTITQPHPFANLPYQLAAAATHLKILLPLLLLLLLLL